jgi:DNA-directed RNA polymerase alpha subunit
MSLKTQMSNLNSYTVGDNIPRIELTSNITDDELQFTLRNVDVSIANSLRRVILSDIPIIVCKVSPNDKNKCNIIANTCGLNNEIVKHRLSCIPIHIKDVEDFPYKNYIIEVNVSNNTDTTIYVTTKDFIVKDLVTGKALNEDKIREIFPPNDLTSRQ